MTIDLKPRGVRIDELRPDPGNVGLTRSDRHPR